MSTGASRYHTGAVRRRADSKDGGIEDGLEHIISKTSVLQLNAQRAHRGASAGSGAGAGASGTHGFINVVSPILLTMASAFVRLFRIGAANRVLWDEAHFGKFGSYYLQHEYYFDVHPPLGKMLVALSGWLAGYDGSFVFESGFDYPENCNFVVMRCFNAVFGILCTPVAYKTALACGFSPWTAWLIGLLVVFEMLSLTLARYILLDSMLLFFTVVSFHCLVQMHNLRLRDKLLSARGLGWLFVSGVAIGCVCLVKWVGFFITAVLGSYTVYDLFIKYCQTGLPRNDRRHLSLASYGWHWVARISTLIVIPFLVYLACFKLHFGLLTKTGTGDGSVSTLLQASLEGNSLRNGPRSVAFGSLVTLRSSGLSPNLLHSHPLVYPEGLQQQQVTTYGFKDDNNDWLLEFDLATAARGVFATLDPEPNATVDMSQFLTQHVVDGDTIRLVHKSTGCLLHLHPIHAFVSKSHYEVSCYADLDQLDYRDEWIIQVQQQQDSPDPYFHDEATNEFHPISTNFRLKHKQLGCFLATTGFQYPSWGFGQGEVVCKYSLVNNDKTTWWNVENHFNDQLEEPLREYVAPKPRFWKEFIMLNYAMMSSNNALIPDKDKFDKLSSEWWQWPILQVGLRMGSWNSTEIKVFLIGHPLITWASTACLVLFVVYAVVTLVLWQRRVIVYPGGVLGSRWNELLIQGIVPFLAWLFNYLPFVIMGRVTYIHHYVPAQYFAIFVGAFLVERACLRLPRWFARIVYLALYAGIVGGFYYLSELALGMVGPSKMFAHLKVLDSWML